MRSFKSDGRYKYNNMGYTYIVQFGWANLQDKSLWSKLVKAFEEMHGPHIERYHDANGWPRSKKNEHYVLEQNRSQRRRRIYLKDEADLTIALLKAG